MWWAIWLILVWFLCLARFPFLGADAGNPGLWTPGYFVADEGYYTAGGRLAYLTGSFLDPQMGEPPTFLMAWGMHVLSYLSHLLGGLHFATARYPTAVLSVIGWLSAYVLVSRVTTPILAGLITAVVSCNPVSLTYERVASTDVVVGSLVIWAFTLATSKRLWKVIAGGVILSAALTVKTTTLGLVPLIFLGILTRRREKWKFAATFAISWISTSIIAWLWHYSYVTSIAVSTLDVDVIAEISRAVAPGLLSFDPAEWIKALSVFPRWPINQQLGPMLIWLIVPACLHIGFRWCRGAYWMTPRSGILIGVLIYLGILATQRQSPIRYFLPALYWIPLLLIHARALLPRKDGPGVNILKTLGWGSMVMSMIYWIPSSLREKTLTDHFYNEYILPKVAAWWLYILPWSFGFLLIFLLSKVLWAVSLRLNQWLVTCGILFVASLLIFASYSVLVPQVSVETTVNQCLMQIELVSLFLVMSLGRTFGGWKMWYGFCLAVFFAFIFLNSHWGSASACLIQPHYRVQEACRTLISKLPPDAIVIGDRAPSYLRATKLRLGISTPNYSPEQFVDRIERLLEQYPEKPLYWLAVPDGYQWSYFEKHGRESLEVQEITSVELPSMQRATFCTVYLYRIQLRRR